MDSPDLYLADTGVRGYGMISINTAALPTIQVALNATIYDMQWLFSF